jgi:zinc transport system substrate-binding protein
MSVFKFVTALSVSLTLSVPAFASPNVVTTIKPVHSLAAFLMQGVGEPYLILKGATSPHDYALKPSDASALQDADLVFWVGPQLEAFLADSLKTVAANADHVALIEAEGLTIHSVRKDEGFEAHDHSHRDGHNHGHDHSSGHDHHHGHDHSHKHDEHKGHDHAHEGHHHGDHHHHAHSGEDAHIWLDTRNALAMAKAMKAHLIEHDPENAELYADNLAQLENELTSLAEELTEKAGSIAQKPFIVFHDAYQYFEKQFGFSASGSVTVNPESLPGAQRVDEIRTRIQQEGIACVFTEPQFALRIVTVVTDGLDVNTGVIDPLGANLDDGPSLYANLMRNTMESMQSCLK